MESQRKMLAFLLLKLPPELNQVKQVLNATPDYRDRFVPFIYQHLKASGLILYHLRIANAHIHGFRIANSEERGSKVKL